jgi:signal transduction histidine kinase
MVGFGAAMLEDDESKLGPRSARYLQKIIAAGERMDQLINDLLDYARFSTSEFPRGAIDAQASLTQALTGLQSQLESSGASVDIPSPLPSVLAHKTVLAVVFSNLLSNALKFVAPGQTPRITISSEDAGPKIRIWLADNGIGIDPQYRDKIFEVFQRLEPEGVYPGTGIGLAIVRRALAQVGGQVGVVSERGNGSRFWVELQKA